MKANCVKVENIWRIKLSDKFLSESFIVRNKIYEMTVIGDPASKVNSHIVVVCSYVHDWMKVPLLFVCSLENCFQTFSLAQSFC